MSAKRPGRVAPLFRSEPQAEVGDKLAFHLKERIRANIERGMAPESARAAALERFGDLESVTRAALSRSVGLRVTAGHQHSHGHPPAPPARTLVPS